MDIRKHVGSKWLKGKDLDSDDDTVLTITEVLLDEVEDEETGDVEELVGVRFKELPKKMLGLNVVNAETLEGMFGWETNDWVGQRIALHFDPEVRMKGQRVGGIRIRARKPPASRSKKATKGSTRARKRRSAGGDGD